MRLVAVLMLITILKVNARPPRVRYDHFAVYKIYINNFNERELINSLLNNYEKYNLWHNGRTEMHLMVHPKELQNFLRIMQQENLIVELLIANVQGQIDAAN